MRGPDVRNMEDRVFDIPSIKLGKLFGIPFEINHSWVIIFGLVAVSLATTYFPSVAGAQGAPAWLLGTLGVVTAFCFFASIVAHELCHSLVTRLEGGKVEKITLFIFGGVAQIEDEPRSPGRELVMAAAGPAMSLLIGGVCFLAYVLTVNTWPWWATSPLSYLFTINVFVGLFNLLPGFPLDGGRVLRSILWAVTGDQLRATRWAARSGQVIGWAMVAISLFAVLNGQTGFIWFGLIGWFIAWLAGASYRQQEMQSRLAGLTVERIMTPHPQYVDGSVTVESFVHEHLLGRQHGRYPVMDSGQIVGVVALSNVKKIPRTDWPSARVIDITDKDLGVLSVDASTPVQQTLSRLSADRSGALLVVKEGHLVGIVTRSDVIDVLNRAPLG